MYVDNFYYIPRVSVLRPAESVTGTRKKARAETRRVCARACPVPFFNFSWNYFPSKKGTNCFGRHSLFVSLSLSLYTTNGLLPLFSRRIARVHSWMTHPTRSARSHTHTHTQTQTEFVFDFFFFFICILKNYTSIWVPGSFWCVTKSSISL